MTKALRLADALEDDRIARKLEIDLTIDPPPDLVIEIDITSPSLDKRPIFGAVGIPEVWRYDGGRVTILRLEGVGYVEAERSAALPVLTDEAASRFLRESTEVGSTGWLRRVRSVGRAAGERDQPDGVDLARHPVPDTSRVCLSRAPRAFLKGLDELRLRSMCQGTRSSASW